MSQVIITHDILQTARTRTQQEEHKIIRMELPTQWRKSDITNTTGFEKLVGITCLPILAIWALLTAFSCFSLSLCLGVFRICNQFVRLFCFSR